MTGSKQRTFTTLDVYLSAFLNLSGIPPKLEANNGRVVFIFPADDDVYRVMENFNRNVNIPVLDFVTAIKALRGRMLTMKGNK